ncbi:hypothetical protein BMS3Abin05_02366 [bacterium BMS3Abin05]|nr:hypothetical protein BMS3Abin05_02366 [bacterium BMS3Abin05]GBE26236.1 hypothetical protein BMS3Bbin03_00148 [bacterium BMS3Bbin03]
MQGLFKFQKSAFFRRKRSVNSPVGKTSGIARSSHFNSAAVYFAFAGIFIIGFLTPNLSFSTSVPNWNGHGKIDGLIRKGIDATIVQKYNLSYAIFDMLIAMNPDDPRGYFYKAAAIQSKMMDREDYSEGKGFLKNIRKTIRISMKILKNHPDDGWASFYAGSAYSYYALYLIHEKKYFKGLRLAQKGIHYLNKAVSSDSTVYDAYLGIGTYEYWRSRKTQFLKWLPLFPDKKKEGLAKIKLAMEKSKYAKGVSLNELVWIEMDRKNWRAAIRFAERGLAQYPGSRFFQWPLAEAYYQGHFYYKAANAFAQLLDSYLKEDLPNHYNAAICAYKVALSAFFDHDYKRSEEYCRKYLSFPNPQALEKRLAKKEKEIRKILSENQKILKRKANTSVP